ncbi:Zinc finger RING-CH-type domain containing protein [Klebsormidium nitens]|uniref:Zinc finger RING-CH-type domain containing protein n=1 Tax=Klebsormidium nitens TaxID=105231 RepID=A0A1Y1I0Z4_KLENI|nr:Zinc finger RING-CH-type domain containing protein [Klebsormidium nitens]|eukprot:GAQ83642.1 Zinc finger RING-CH-type domain containing protein [Klebsormidium nitens]
MQGDCRNSTGESRSPVKDPAYISRLIHAASWDVGTQLLLQPEAATAFAEVDVGQPGEAVRPAGSRKQESSHLSLLSAVPLSCAQPKAPQQSLQLEVSCSHAVAGPQMEEPPLWPMETLRRALSWGKDRMNSGWSTYSNAEFCRICYTIGAEEPLIEIGCDCRDGLNLAHRTCITHWFTSRGNNKCEICTCEAANIPAPLPLLPQDPSRPAPSEPERAPPTPIRREAVRVARIYSISVSAAVLGVLSAAVIIVIVSRS